MGYLETQNYKTVENRLRNLTTATQCGGSEPRDEPPGMQIISK